VTQIITIGFSFFALGIAVRVLRIASMPVHLRWELYPLPGSALEKIRVMASEILLLRGVHAHHRALWIWSWLFHLSLYLLIVATGLSLVAALFRSVREGLTSGIAILSVLAFAGGTVGAAALIVMRFASRRMRPFASFAAFFNLGLLFAIFASGLAHAFVQPDAARVMVEQGGSLLALNPAPHLHPVAVAHLCLGAFFIAYLPFTQMAHGVLKYFTYHWVRWDDRSADQMPGHADRMKRYLAFPVSWSAAHIREGSTKPSWTEAVSGKDPHRSIDRG